MAKSKANYTEIDNIREDLDSLKTNVVELTKHVKKDGQAQTQAIGNSVMDRWSKLQDSSRKQYQNVEKHVKDKPAQSMALAFGIGLAASMLMRRR